MLKLETVVNNVEDFLVNTETARYLSERDRDYKDHNQWTEEERCEIESRGQVRLCGYRPSHRLSWTLNS